MPIRVLIADDHHLFALALEALLDHEDGVDVVGRALNGREALELTQSLRPHVVTLDISMPVMDGFEAAALIRALPDPPKVLMLTGSNSLDDIDRARHVGANGYITKGDVATALIAAILAAASS